jgi:hypothetical protein
LPVFLQVENKERIVETYFKAAAETVTDEKPSRRTDNVDNLFDPLCDD